MRDRPASQHQQNPHSPLFVHSVCVWTGTRRPVSDADFCHAWLLFALACRAIERQEPSSAVYSESTVPQLLHRLNTMTSAVTESLNKQGFEGKRVMVERYLNMRWDGTDTALMALGSSPRGDEGPQNEDFEEAFKKAYKHEFGFLLEEKRIIVDDVKVRPVLSFGLKRPTKKCCRCGELGKPSTLWVPVSSRSSRT